METNKPKKSSGEWFKDNAVLVALMLAGLFLCYIALEGSVGSRDFYLSTGIALISAGGVGIFMMLTTRNVARNIYKRLDETNSKLDKLDKIVELLQKIESKIH